ncbi:hypothetical protein [Streptomyces sp. NK15101]|uniref:hypothetical protein n=1 Tax=Streptomyces sp. NK15101 TaxID=2873261 RepID=UPI001CEC1CE5|nr:hypothetical protein [Streptomyces sp. NK15101]
MGAGDGILIALLTRFTHLVDFYAPIHLRTTLCETTGLRPDTTLSFASDCSPLHDAGYAGVLGQADSLERVTWRLPDRFSLCE